MKTILIALSLIAPSAMAYDYQADAIDAAEHSQALEDSNNQLQEMNRDFIHYQGGSNY